MQLGFKPDNLRVYLTTGADFYCQLTLTSGTYAVGSTLSLKFGSGPTWTATRDSATSMTFSVDKVQTDAIPAGDGVRLNYVNGTLDQTWAIGEVVRSG